MVESVPSTFDLSVDEVIALTTALELPIPIWLFPDVDLGGLESRKDVGRARLLARGLVRQMQSGPEVDALVALCLEMTNCPPMVTVLLSADKRFQVSWLFSSPRYTVIFTRLGSSGGQRVELVPTSAYLPRVCGVSGLNTDSPSGSSTLRFSRDPGQQASQSRLSTMKGLACGVIATAFATEAGMTGGGLLSWATVPTDGSYLIREDGSSLVLEPASATEIRARIAELLPAGGPAHS